MTRRQFGRRAHRLVRRRPLRFESLELRRVLATFVVTTIADVVDSGDSETSLREAVTEANAAPGQDSIVFDTALFQAPAKIELVAGQLDLTDSLLITGPGEDLLAIDALGGSRVIGFDAVSGNLTVQGLTLIGGRTTGEDINANQSGAGIRFRSAGTLTLSRASVVGNHTTGTGARGGGIFADPGNVVLDHSAVIGNSTAGIDATGGGIFAGDGTILLSDSIVSGNQTEQTGARGGGIYSSGSPVSVVRSSVIDNRTLGPSADGGGMLSLEGATIDNSIVSGNRTLGIDSDGGGLFARGTVAVLGSDVSSNSTLSRDSVGGGIAADSALVVIRNSSIAGNEIAGQFGLGAGLFAIRADVTITGSTISGNRATGPNSDGGGVSSFFSSMTVTHGTITDNSATGQGGGVAFVDNTGKTLRLENSILAGNSDSGIAPDFVAPFDPQFLDVQSTLVGDNTGTTLAESRTGDINGNLIGDPSGEGVLDPELDGLFLVGVTRVHPLAATSAAVNAADNGLAALIPSDQRGAPFNRVVGFVADMGAYELQAIDPSRLVVTTATDTLNFTDPEVTLREAIQVANGQPGADVISFDSSLLGGDTTIDLQRGQLTITDTVTIDTNSAGDVTLDAGGQSRVIQVSEGNVDVTLTGLVVSGGRTSRLDDGGGGIAFDSAGTLTLSQSTVAGNETGGDGARGGGIQSAAGRLVLDRSTVTMNSTHGQHAHGGGIYGAGGVVVLESTVADNRTAGPSSHGGGLFASGGAATALWLLRSTVSENETLQPDSHGGGIAIGAGPIDVTNSTVSTNSAAGDGGGIYSSDSEAVNHRIASSTVAMNNSQGVGGGLSLAAGVDGSVKLVHSMIATNTALDSVPDVDFSRVGGNVILESSLIGDNAGTTFVESQTPDALGNLIGSSGGLGAIDPLLGTLQTRGGPTKSHSLLPGSPAIDAGDSSLLASLTTDQRGTPFVRSAGAAPDMGAFETQTLAAAMFVVTTSLDELDFENSDVSLREALELASGNQGVATVRFDPAVFGQPSSIDLVHGELTITESVRLIGPGEDRLTIDAQGNSRVFQIVGDSIDVTLESLTITGGMTTGNNQPGDPNQATVHSGGGIRFQSNGNLSLDRITLTGNRTTGTSAGGGGVFVELGNLHVDHSTITSNRTVGTAAAGGGIHVHGATLSIVETLVSQNETEGIASHGGGIMAEDSSVTIARSAITQNRSLADSADGGGLHISASTLDVFNSTFSGNTAVADDASGGGLFASDVSARIVNSTITENSAVLAGGGLVATSDGSLRLENSIVAGNFGPSSSTDLLVTLSSAQNLMPRSSLIGDQQGTILVESQTADANGNRIGSSLGDGVINPMLGPLAFNAGATPTHSPLSGSPAIDAGNDTLAVDWNLQPLASDQRGAPFDRRFNVVDIGSFEVQPPREPIIHWDRPENIFVGTALSEIQLNATADTAGSFTYTPDVGTILPLQDDQTLAVEFVPQDTLYYAPTSATVLLSVVEQSDLGDAPDSYATLRADGGPRHSIGALRLGDAIDAEVDGKPTAAADGDGADEDGVSLVTSLVTDASQPNLASVLVNASSSSKLDAWIDFDGNGAFDHASEHLGGGNSINLSIGDNVVSFTIPAGAVAGASYARFRLSSQGGLLPTGAAGDGEVEDYAVTIIDGQTVPTVEIDMPRGPSTLLRQDGDLIVRHRDQDLFRAPAATIGRYEIRDDDFTSLFTIDANGGDPVPAGGMAYDGGDRINTVRVVGPFGLLDLSRDGNLSAMNIDVIDIVDPSDSTVVLDANAARAMDPTGGGIIIVGSEDDRIVFDDGPNWRMVPPTPISFLFSVVTLPDTFVQVDFAMPWQNLAQPSDVNNDGNATAGDALRIINELSERSFSDAQTGVLVSPFSVPVWPNAYFDQNGDGLASALDALRVINQISMDEAGSGFAEGEAIVDNRSRPTDSAQEIAVQPDMTELIDVDQQTIERAFSPLPLSVSLQPTRRLATEMPQPTVDPEAVDELLDDSNFVTEIAMIAMRF